MQSRLGIQSIVCLELFVPPPLFSPYVLDEGTAEEIG